MVFTNFRRSHPPGPILRNLHTSRPPYNMPVPPPLNDGSSSDSDREEDVTPDRTYDLIQSLRERVKQSSQYKIRAYRFLAKWSLRTDTHVAIVSVNENKNISYFSTTQDYFKFTELIAALEREKLNPSANAEMTTNLQEIMEAHRGTSRNDGVDFMTSTAQRLTEIGIDNNVLDAVRAKYMDTLTARPSFDVASALKKVIEDALQCVAVQGFDIGTDDGEEMDDDEEMVVTNEEVVAQPGQVDAP